MSKSLYTTIIENSAPTSATVGVVGQRYINTTTSKEYLCMAVTAQGTNPETYTYTWVEIVTGNNGIPYLTTAPSSANTSGNLQFVVLSSEPATRYSGYIYFITES